MRTLPCSELCQTRDLKGRVHKVLTYLGQEVYSEPRLFRHIEAYLIMIVVIALTFFYHCNHTYFSARFKKRHMFFDNNDVNFNARLSLLKGAFSGLGQFLATKSPLKRMKNACYFTLNALFVLKIFKFLSWLFGHVEKRLD